VPLGRLRPSAMSGGAPYAAAKGRLTSLRALGSTNSRELFLVGVVFRRLERELAEPSGIEPLTSCMP